MRYTVTDRVWTELHGTPCWIIPGREIVTATIGTAGSSGHFSANRGPLTEQDRIERITRCLTNRQQASAYAIAIATCQGYAITFDTMLAHPELFAMSESSQGRTDESDIWCLRE